MRSRVDDAEYFVDQVFPVYHYFVLLLLVVGRHEVYYALHQRALLGRSLLRQLRAVSDRFLHEGPPVLQALGHRGLLQTLHQLVELRAEGQGGQVRERLDADLGLPG